MSGKALTQPSKGIPTSRNGGVSAGKRNPGAGGQGAAGFTYVEPGDQRPVMLKELHEKIRRLMRIPDSARALWVLLDHADALLAEIDCKKRTAKIRVDISDLHDD